MAPGLLHGFFYLKIAFSTWFILKPFPLDLLLFFPQNSNASPEVFTIQGGLVGFFSFFNLKLTLKLLLEDQI